MPKDGLVRLPDKAAASLLLALESLPRRQQALILRRPDLARAPNWNRLVDYDVFFKDSLVGRVWRYDYRNEPHEGYPWHWRFQRRRDNRTIYGHAMSLDDALAAFRKAWDATKEKAAG